jgi:predicted Zn-dependent protease
LSAALSVLLAASCAINPVTCGRELMFVSEAQEIRIGREAAPSLNWTYGGEFRDADLEAYLGGIVRRLWENSERPGLPMKFAVQNTSVPNAFALPGYVAVTRGLLAGLDSEAQFAAIMGHEVGHVMARHTAKRLTQATLRQLGLGVGGSLLSGTGQRDLIMGVGALSSSLLLLKYGRDDELQADRLGVRYMAELGYDPAQAIAAHRRLQAEVSEYRERLGIREGDDSLLGAILSTHPREEVRLEEIEQMIRGLPPHALRGDGVFRDRFLEKTSRLRDANRAYIPYDRARKLYGEDRLGEAEALLGEAMSLEPGQAPFYNLYGMILLKRRMYPEAKSYFDKALGLYPGYQPAIYGLGLALFSRESYEAALSQFKMSLALYPSHPGSLFGAGASSFKLQRPGDAIPYLSEFASQAPDHPQVHGMLGMCYEAAGDLRAAARQYELQLSVAPDNEFGRHAAARLLLLKGIPIP